MKNLARMLFCCVVLCGLAQQVTAQEGARDAEAVLNRCGKPLKGDDTVYSNTESTRTLLYERGTLLFTRVGDHGWKFVSGSHKGAKGLTAAQMAAFMPCLTAGLADSASPEPIKPISSAQRLEVSAKGSYRLVVLLVLLGLVVVGAILFLLSRRKPADEDD